MDFVKFCYTDSKSKEQEIGLRPSDVIFVFKEGENCTRLRVRGEKRKAYYTIDVNEPIDSVIARLNYRN